MSLTMMKKSHLKDGNFELHEVGNQDQEDRISSLPDSALCHILSYLPTKYAVATSILSSRWKFLWTSVRNLCFDNTLRSEYHRYHKLSKGSKARFENFVNRVLLLTEPQNIDKLSLKCDAKLPNPSSLKLWVSSAIIRNVREIEFRLSFRNCFELPESIYTSKTLEVLRLNADNIVFKIPATGVCFPSVKILHIDMRDPNEDLTERLFCACPVLQELSIEAYSSIDFGVTRYNISSSTLKRLTIKLLGLSYYECHDRKIMLKTPKLEYLYITQDSLVSYTMHEPYSLSEVDIYITTYCEGDVRNNAPHALHLLKFVSKTKSLALSASTLSVLNFANGDCFPTFPNLTYLDMEILETQKHLIPIILNCCHNLETFVFGQVSCISSFIEELEWLEPQYDPDCLLISIKKIEIRNFDGQKGELELVRYLLKHGEVLKRLTVRCKRKSSEEKLRLCQKLLMFERGSKLCQVELL